MKIIRVIEGLLRGLEKLGLLVRKAIGRISVGASSSDKLRNTNMTNLIVGTTSIVALVVLIVAIFSPYFSNPDMYFWVYSTIIQAFAAMIALVAIFLIYRLEMLKWEEQSILERLINNLISTELSFKADAGQKTTPQMEEWNQRRLERLPKHKIIQEARLILCELQQKINKGGFRGGDLATPEDMKDRINTDLQNIERRKKYKVFLVSSIRPALMLVGILISLSLFLLPFSSGTTNPYAKAPLSFLLIVVLGLSIITLLEIIKTIIRILEKETEWEE